MNTSLVDARDARLEAAERLARGYDVRVLEPSPPAVTDPPWFADDPVAVEGDRPDDPLVVSPVPNADLTWIDVTTDDAALHGWAAARWLVTTNRLLLLPAAYHDTREALHLIAVHVVARARHAANGKFGLRWTLGGFGTPFFGADEQVRMAEEFLVVQRGDHAEHATVDSLAQVAALAQLDLQQPFSVGDDTPAIDDAIVVDRAAAKALGEWYGFGASLLELVRCDLMVAGGDASRVQLWPEHFDLAMDGARPGGVRTNIGVSPGDAFHPDPYLYIGPWERQDGPFWNAPFGAFLPYSEIVQSDQQRALALAFVNRGLARLGP